MFKKIMTLGLMASILLTGCAAVEEAAKDEEKYQNEMNKEYEVLSVSRIRGGMTFTTLLHKDTKCKWTLIEGGGSNFDFEPLLGADNKIVCEKGGQ